MSGPHRLELTTTALETIQDGLAALRGLYATQAEYGRRDDHEYWLALLRKVDEAANTIKSQTGVGLPRNPNAPPVSSY